LKNDLGANNVLFTREPFEQGLRSEIYDAIKKGYSPQAVMFMFLADRAEHIEKVIKPALQKNIPVISDRYMDSTIAYQGATLKDHLKVDELSLLRNLHKEWVLIPDLTILLDINEKKALKRISGRSDTYIDEYEKADHLQTTRLNFLELVSREPRRFVIVDADRKPEQLQRKVKEILFDYFPSLES